MSSPKKDHERLFAAIAKKAEALRLEATQLLPEEAIVVGGKYDGRLGRVTGAILWGGDGLLVGFYVYCATRPGAAQINRQILNSDVESRRYRKVSELKFIYQGELRV